MKLHSLGFTALHLSVCNMHEEATKVLLRIADDGWISERERTQGFTAFHMASENDDDDILYELLKNGAQISLKDDRDMTALHIAVERGHVNAVKEILVHGQTGGCEQVNRTTSLYLAVKNSFYDVVDVLIK